jgi:TIR domain
MRSMAVDQVGEVFIAYRRGDSGSAAARLGDHLERLGLRTFRDIDAIAPGRDFREEIAAALVRAEVVLVVIGAGWLTASDEKGVRRLLSPEDTHRLEVAAALRSDAMVIPVLVEGARLPSAAELPRDLEALAFRQAWRLEDAGFAHDVEQLGEHVRAAQGQVSGRAAAVSAPPPPRQLVQGRFRSWRPRSVLEWLGLALASYAAVLLLVAIGYWVIAVVLRADPTATSSDVGPALLLFSALMLAGLWTMSYGRRRRRAASEGRDGPGTRNRRRWIPRAWDTSGRHRP